MSVQKKRKANSAQTSSALSLHGLLANPDVMKSLGPFLSISHGRCIEVWRPCLVLFCRVRLLSFIEQTNDGTLWKVTHYRLSGYWNNGIEHVYYRRESSLSLAEFLKKLFRQIYDYHNLLLEGNEGKSAYKIFFSEARSEKSYKEFLAAYKSKLVSSWRSGYEGQAKKKFCIDFDPCVGRVWWNIDRNDDIYLLLMQRKFSPCQLKVSHIQKKGPKLEAKRQYEFARFVEAFESFSRGELLLQPDVNKVTIFETLFPFDSLKEMIFSKYDD